MVKLVQFVVDRTVVLDGASAGSSSVVQDEVFDRVNKGLGLCVAFADVLENH